MPRTYLLQLLRVGLVPAAQVVIIIATSGVLWAVPSDGTVKSYRKISATAGGFTGDSDSFDDFGLSSSNLGGLDGDGVPGLAVGAYKADDGGTNLAT